MSALLKWLGEVRAFAVMRYATDYDKTVELPDGVREDVC